MSSTQLAPSTSAARWRTVDIVLTAVIAVAGGIIFAVYNQTYKVLDPLWAAFPPSSGLQTGVWLFPGILAALVIRRPGAGLFAELVAAVISALFGSSFGLTVLVSGALQGLGAELGSALVGRYRRFGLPVALAAGALTGFACGINDAFLMQFYPEYPASWLWAYVGFVTLSGLITGVVMWFLTRGLAATGVLAPLRSRGANREGWLG